MFRYKQGVNLSYNRQLYIYARSLNYKNEPPEVRAKIDGLCERHGKNNADALKEYVTTSATVTALCLKYHIASKTTILRAVKAYYENFPAVL